MDDGNGEVPRADGSEGADRGDTADDDRENDGFERPIDKFRQTATGAVIAAGLLGLGDALEGRREKEETAIVQEASEPVRDLDIVIDLEHPERTVAILREPPPAEN
jgi:hypothetical protein